MEKYIISKPRTLLGSRVESFPAGIREAFQSLMQKIPDSNKRGYYGVSMFNDKGQIIYVAAAEEAYPGEANIYRMDNYTIEAGEYSAVTICNWMEKTDSIADVFRQLMAAGPTDSASHCVEWYRNEREMMCLLKNR